MCIQCRITFLVTVLVPQKLAKADVKKMPTTGFSFTTLWVKYIPLACVLCILE